MNPFNLKGKNIIITGASSGIGQQCAISCSQMGARIILIGRNTEHLQNTFEQMENPVEHVICPLDLTDYKQVPIVIDKYIKSHGVIDGLVNCAGIGSLLTFDFISYEKINSIFNTNVYSGILLTKEVCKKGHFSKNGGSIIFLSSIMGLVGDAGKSLYSMTKGALISTTRSLACEFARKKIRVNSISPGAIVTPINENLPYLTNPIQRQIIEQKHLLGLGNTTDVANACIYLLSDASKWVTGTNLVVDGGYTAK